VPQFSQTAPDQQNNIESQALTTGQESYRNSNDQQQQFLSTSYDANPSGIPPQQQQQQPQQQQQQQQQQPQQQQQLSFGGSSQQVSQSSFNNFQQQQQGISSQNTFGSSFSQDSQSDELPPIITKHFYVHAAPEEPEETKGPRFVNVGRKQKNYKIIFIKAPTYGFNSQVIPVVAPNEEKTIVYVLSKKPSFNQDISLPPVPVTEPSKPEVFFIKYKTDSEAQEAQQKIQGAYETSNLGGSNDNVFTNVAGTIGTAINSFQNQASATFNTVANQAQGVATGFANSIGSVVGSQSCSGGSGCSSGSKPTTNTQSQTQTIGTAGDEQQEYNAGASENAISANLVEAQSASEQPAQQEQPQQQNDVHEEYLPPNH